MCLAAACLAAAISAAHAQAPAAPPLSSTAERVFAEAKPRIVQVRTLLVSAGRQSSIGSGFLVSADGLAVTNYHVVSQYALDPASYKLEYLAPDGSKGTLTLLAIDVAHDLAVVRLERASLPYFEFDPRAVANNLPKGERIYSLGNPLDLGFTIVEGTYNGLVDKSYDEHIHFSGAINPGMSGGPVANAEGRIVGVNVSKRLDGESVSFLVPAKHAAALVEQARTGKALDVKKAREEVGRQLEAWQRGFYGALEREGFKPTPFGPYRGSESAAPWITCWARTNADQLPKPKVAIQSTQCNSGGALFVSDKIVSGRVDMGFSYHKSAGLNAFQFAEALRQQSTRWSGNAARRLTEQQCEDRFVAGVPGKRPLLRATWCTRAYRDFEGLYNVTIVAATQDRSTEALVAQISMLGISHANAVSLGRRFLETLEVAP